jgi:uncharacterized membrane protein
MIVVAIVLVVISIVLIFLSGLAAEADKFGGALFASLASAVFLSMGLAAGAEYVHEDAVKEGKRKASVQCTLAECPYTLTQKPDSTRVWTENDAAPTYSDLVN